MHTVRLARKNTTGPTARAAGQTRDAVPGTRHRVNPAGRSHRTNFPVRRSAIGRSRLPAQTWCVGGSILVFFGLLGALDGLVWRHNPIESVLLFHLGKDK